MQLNLPTFDIRTRNHKGRPQVFDPLRRRFVALTPEEWVRQHFVNFLIHHRHFPAGLMANEMELAIGDKRLRCDTLLYNKDMRPQMIVEYKAPHIALTQKVIDQITAYNLLLHVDYLVVSNGLEHFCCHMDYDNQRYSFLTDIPEYADL